jgi:DnaK suppressor protein
MDPDDAARLLHGERRRIERTLRDLGEVDSEEAFSGQDQAYNEQMRDGLMAELAAVERAESRLADGTYGLSVESGEPIPDGRLKVFPAAERTEQEQERFDQQEA